MLLKNLKSIPKEILTFTLEDTTVCYSNTMVGMENCSNVMKDHHQLGHAWLQWAEDHAENLSKFLIQIMKTMKSTMIAHRLVK